MGFGATVGLLQEVLCFKDGALLFKGMMILPTENQLVMLTAFYASRCEQYTVHVHGVSFVTWFVKGNPAFLSVV